LDVENGSGEDEKEDDDDDDEIADSSDDDRALVAHSNSFNAMLTEFEEQDQEENFVPLKGNLYRLLFLNRRSFKEAKTGTLGFISVVIVQLFAPFAIFFWAFFRINWRESTISPCLYKFGSHEAGLSHLLKYLLANAFLFCYTLNGLSVLKQDHEMSIKFNMLVAYVDKDPAKVRELQKNLNYCWLHLGTFVTATMPIMCTAGLFLLFIISGSPKDVIFDSLGMTFLYTLDDIDGPLGLLSSKDWNEERMGRFYFKMVQPRIGSANAEDVHRKQRFVSEFGSPLFTVCTFAMRVFAIILPIAFFFTEGIVVQEE